MTEFTWIDGERLIRFGSGCVGEAPGLLAGRGFEEYALLTTERAAAAAPAVVDAAGTVLEVPPGLVADCASAVRPGVGGRPVVALGGGRVVDAAKAVAAAEGLACAALPTTLAGSPMTGFHRLPAGVSGVAPVRPAMVVWDPDLVSSLPRAQLVATALNALAHGFESLYGPRANPVGELAALRAAAIFAAELPREQPSPTAVSLAALLAGYAVGASGLAVHHAVCQTVVQRGGLSHAEVNAVVLPHSVAFMAGRAPAAVGRFATALGEPDGDPAGAPGRVARLALETGVDGLAQLGLEADAIAGLAGLVVDHPALANTPGAKPTAADVAAILHAAL